MTIVPLGIDHVVLRVTDMEAALRFYSDVIGCREERRVDDLGLVQLRAGRALIDLVAVDGRLGRAGGAPPGEEGRNMDHLALRIEDFDEAALRAHLTSHGVEVGEVATRYGAEGDGPSLYIRDADGNTIELKGPPAG
jgi:glyoxylase I family protein